MSAKKSTPKPIHHTLHEFLFALSYWGSWTRSLLFFVLISLMLALTLSGVSSELANTTQHFWYTTLSITAVIIYSLGFFVYDASYVTIARRSPLKHRVDRLALFTAEILAVMAIFSTWLVYEGDISMTTIYIALFGALLVLPIRAAVGVVGQRG